MNYLSCLQAFLLATLIVWPPSGLLNSQQDQSVAFHPPAPLVQQAEQLQGAEPPYAPPDTDQPDKSRQAINPLNGLPVADPGLLNNPPALVSITNFPPTARPQAGLSFSPYVFEFFIGEGMTRFLAVFYGEYPRTGNPSSGGGNGEDAVDNVSVPSVGPVRSGRLPYEHVRKLFNGFIVMASAASNVASTLKDYVNVYGTDQSDPNSALMPVERLAEIAGASRQELPLSALDVNRYGLTPPEGGRAAHRVLHRRLPRVHILVPVLLVKRIGVKVVAERFPV